MAEHALSRWPRALVIVVSGNLLEVNPLAARFPRRIATLAKPLTEAALGAALAELCATGQGDKPLSGIHR